ncbi:Uncharacterized conserved protein YndB, AHSA1/START domain [Seinonella peptonophila]|uniref:Uncharacterized conserved protein YndB, AHSA1/START domain n=1 Tax=Seinonella peptonophila TaxID=112248 RepID=A0A1M4ZMV4_9BACL|nr:SRPBCC family protein [Seinonella peptonophila]SHF19430.1 Uncharacterized conserved protein YndB, AHSA1/START domain [Seinonella peptonophila]
MKNLQFEFYIDGTLEQVWKALIDPEFTKQLYYGSIIESSFKVGEPLVYVGPGAEGERTTHVYGTVLAYEPNKKLSFTHFTGKAYNPDTEKYESRITYELEQVGQSTKLLLIHDQLKEDDPSYAGSQKGWPMILSNTKTLIETGKTLVFD